MEKCNRYIFDNVRTLKISGYGKTLLNGCLTDWLGMKDMIMVSFGASDTFKYIGGALTERMKKLDEFLAHSNCYLCFVRGPEESEEMFKDFKTIGLNNILFLLDYSLLTFGKNEERKNIMVIGGGVSPHRWWVRKHYNLLSRYNRNIPSAFRPDDCGVQFNEDVLCEICESDVEITSVISYMCPSNDGTEGTKKAIRDAFWNEKDPGYLDDVGKSHERLRKNKDFLLRKGKEPEYWIFFDGLNTVKKYFDGIGIYGVGCYQTVALDGIKDAMAPKKSRGVGISSGIDVMSPELPWDFCANEW